MKKYAAIVFSVLVVVVVVTSVLARVRRTAVVQVQFNKRDLPKHGVQLITSADPDFANTVSKHFKNRLMDSGESLQPFSVFIKNSSKKTIVAYRLVWQLVKSNGQILTNKTAYSEPGVLMGNPIPLSPSFKHTQAIEPDAVRCFSWSGPITEEPGRLGSAGAALSKVSEDSRAQEPTAFRAHLTAELADATDLTVSLDGVFFDDGTFIGPNTTGYFDQVKAMVTAKLDLLREVAIASEQGKTDEAFEAIKAKSLARSASLTSASSPDDYYSYYIKIFASDLIEMRAANGEERLAAYLKRLDKQPRPQLRKEFATGGEFGTRKIEKPSGDLH